MARLRVGASSSPRDGHSLPTQQRIVHTPKDTTKPGLNLSSLCNRQSLFMLTIGLLVGYIVMPILLIEQNFPTQSIGALPQQRPNEGFAHGSRTLEGGDVLTRLMEDRDAMSHHSIPTSTTPQIMHTKTLPDHHRKKILITGGAGFVGSHLVDKLMMQGHEVIVVDNFFTGQKKNIAHWLHHPNFR